MAQKKVYSVKFKTVIAELDEIEAKANRYPNFFKSNIEEKISYYAKTHNAQIESYKEIQKLYNDLKKRHGSLVKEFLAEIKQLGVEVPAASRDYLSTNVFDSKIVGRKTSAPRG